MEYPQWILGYLDLLRIRKPLKQASEDLCNLARHVREATRHMLVTVWAASMHIDLLLNLLLQDKRVPSAKRPRSGSGSMPWTIPLTLMVLWGVFWRYPQPVDWSDFELGIGGKGD